MPEDQARLKGVRQYFPECEAVSCSIELDGEREITVYVDLGFPKADPNLIDRRTCAALCDYVRRETREGFAILKGGRFAREMTIRVQLSFFEQGVGRAITNDN